MPARTEATPALVESTPDPRKLTGEKIAKHRARVAAGDPERLAPKREPRSITVRSFEPRGARFDETGLGEAVLSRLANALFGASPPKDAMLVRVAPAGGPSPVPAPDDPEAKPAEPRVERGRLVFMVRGAAEISKANLVLSDGKTTALTVTQSSAGIRLDGKAERGTLVYLVLAGTAKAGEKIEVLLMGGGKIEAQ